MVVLISSFGVTEGNDSDAYWSWFGVVSCLSVCCGRKGGVFLEP